MKAEIFIVAAWFVCAGAVVVCGQPQEVARKLSPARELIEQAHRYDRAYHAGPEADQRKALASYQAALDAHPNSGERLHSLFRMAQLHSTSFQPAQGERPDYRKAVSLYEQIVTEYPADDPLVLRAMMALSDYYTLHQEYEKAARWSQRVLRTDTRKLEQRLEAAEDARESPDPNCPLDPNELAHFAREYGGLKRSRKAIELSKRAAVDQVAYTMGMIDPLWAQAELKRLIAMYDGTPIGERAQMRLDESMNRAYATYHPDADPVGPAAVLGAGAGPALVTGAPSRATEPNAWAAVPGVAPDAAPNPSDATISDGPSQVDEATDKMPRAPPAWSRATGVIFTVVLVVVLCILLPATAGKRESP